MLRPHWMPTAREIKVGAFVLIGLVLVGIVIFLIGDERQLFSSRVVYQVVFDDVEGLKKGSTVRMGGIDVGSVESVGYSKNSRDSRLYITMRVVETEAKRLRRDSRAKIEAKGLLGDKMITLTSGSPDQPALPPGATIIAEKDPNDLGSAMARVGEITAKAERILANLEGTTAVLADEKLGQNVKASMESLTRILAAVDQGPGYVSKLLHDPAEAERISSTLANLEHASLQLDQTLARVQTIAGRIESGPGLVHNLVYEETAAHSIEQIGAAAEQVSVTLAEIQKGRGIGHSLLFGDDQSVALMQELNRIVADARAITADVRAGKGTLGALLVDPSVYEDLKVVLGNVERNRALRALVRYSVKQDEAARSVQVVDPAKGTPPKADVER
jgi:phospholipid/cholesterol/gamma-HCH transport system substrate-binding protein